MLQSLTKQLGAGQGALLTADGRSEGNLVARLLSLTLGDSLPGKGAIFAPLTGELAGAFLGPELQDPHGTFGIAAEVSGGALHVSVGYAALRQPLEATLAGARLGGELGEHLKRAIEVLQMVTEPSLGGTAAREALRAAMWPAIAAIQPPPEALITAIETLSPAHSVNLKALCLLPSVHELSRSPPGLQVRQVMVSIHSVDPNLLQRLLLSGRRR